MPSFVYAVCSYAGGKVCGTGCHPRQSVVHLPHGGGGTERGGAGGKFAWLTAKESPTQDANPRPSSSTAGVGGDDTTKNDYAGISRDKTPPSWLFLSVGALSKQPRGQCYKKPLPLSATHLLYVPTTRSIVVACDDHRSKATAVAEAVASGASRGEAEQQVFPPPNFTSSLRVFDADTLDERPGGPLQLLPGVRVTGMAHLGHDPLRCVPREMDTGAATPWADGGESPPAAAVGGDVVAVACSSARAWAEGTPRDDDGRQREHEEVRQHRVNGVTSGCIAADSANANGADIDIDYAASNADHDECKSDALVSVLAAFEVVACASHVATGAEGGIGRSASRCKVANGKMGSGTILAPLAAAPEMEGVCFCLKTLSGCFVAASVDDKVVVFGWGGSRGGLR